MNPEEINKKLPREKGKLNIYFHVSENSGVGYYRQYLPALKLRDHKLANVLISDFRWGKGEHVEPNMESLMEFMKWADIVVVGRKDMAQFYSLWGTIKEFFNMPIVLDTDDNVRFVRPNNPGYMGYAPNSDSLQWNSYAISKIFSAVTVSTENLKEFHKKENPRISVLPNNIDLKDWDSHEKPKHDNIRLAFVGSAAHTEGMNIIKKPVVDILKKYPNTELLITGIYRKIFADMKEAASVMDRIKDVPWIELEEWPKKSKELGVDIGLAPLADNNFNRAKSNLRWLEYAAQKAAPIVSPVEPYLCVKDTVDALVAKEPEDWFDAMEKLVTNAELRYNIATNAYERVKQEFDIDKNIELWLKTYKDIHDSYHSFFGKKKQFITSKKGWQEIKPFNT